MYILLAMIYGDFLPCIFNVKLALLVLEDFNRFLLKTFVNTVFQTIVISKHSNNVTSNHWKKGPNNEEGNNWIMSTIIQKVKACSDMEHSA